ncbi:hypothetical protein [Cellulosimicrobium aquatile]|uniref:hypothetical protein n=1 Tax=Cellulosimicrobium aquatile TaxID=1612203 RepID=UPI001459D3D3|nr:hypothetical protein [Cellulosimicrobium aquatile]NMF29617.1 hypothetical protein [Cellulosimicrobium aquatile]
MTALVALERGYAFQTLAGSARRERADPDEHDVEPDSPEPGDDPGPMPTPTDHEETHVSDERTVEHDDFCEAEEVITGGWTSCACAYRAARGLVANHDDQVRGAERERIAKAIENLPTTWPNGVKHSAAWMRLEAADVARYGADA